MIVYFSATGNSRHTAERIAAALHTEAVSIEQLPPVIDLAADEVFGVVTPTYFYELPTLTRAFLEKLTLAGAHYTFLVATCGMTPGCCGEDARRILAQRGIVLSASFSVRMPESVSIVSSVRSV